MRTHFLCFLRTPPVVIFPKHSFINEAPGPATTDRGRHQCSLSDRKGQEGAADLQELSCSPQLSGSPPVVVAEEGPDANVGKLGQRISVCSGLFHPFRASILHSGGHGQCGGCLALTGESFCVHAKEKKRSTSS